MPRIPDPTEIDGVWYIKLPERRVNCYDFDNAPLDRACAILAEAADGMLLATFTGDGDYDESWISIYGYRLATSQEILDYQARKNDLEERKRQNAEKKRLQREASKTAADQKAIARIMADAKLQYQMAKELANAGT